tara:strand:+ start:699 stop:1247 length:549 start_codon:yes stop_codon:yes gene_type:complete
MSLSLGADEIIISSPKGYCINQETQRRHLSGFSVIISDCFTVSNNKVRTLVRSPVRSLVTVTVSNAKITSEDELNSLDSLIMSGALDNAFGRSNQNISPKILKRSKSNGVYYMCFEEDLEDLELEAASQSRMFCRAIFVLNERVVSLVGSDYSSQYSDDKRVEILIQNTVSELLKSNRPNET